MVGSAVTLAQLLALGLLAEHEVLGGAAGLHRPVRMVVPVGSVHGLSATAPGSVVVFDPAQLALDELSADLALRLAHSAGSAGIIAGRPPRPVPLVTKRLADKLAMPLVGVDALAPAAVAAAFDPYVRAPEIAGLRILGSTAQRFQTPPSSPAELTRTLGQTLGGPVALTDGESRFVAGDPDAHQALSRPEIRAQLDRPRSAPGTFALGETDTLLMQPVQLGPAAPANFWIIARLGTATAALLEPIRQSMAVAALSFAVYLARRAAELEREGRRRSVLLGEILDQAQTPAAGTVERATALGWRLAGWHTGVQVSVRGAARAVRGELVGELEERLAGAGVPASLVERPDGVVFWTTGQTEADALDPRPLMDSVRTALLAVRSEHPGLWLYAGVGGARAGTAGIQRSLQEARGACLLAGARNEVAAVEHVDAVSMKRLLVGWYSSGPLRAVAAELLAPLLDADASGELVRTLRTYLDAESSATETAARLGVHRNTVMQRVERIRRLMAVDLTDADDRIVVHLATRVVGVEGEAGP